MPFNDSRPRLARLADWTNRVFRRLVDVARGADDTLFVLLKPTDLSNLSLDGFAFASAFAVSGASESLSLSLSLSLGLISPRLLQRGSVEARLTNPSIGDKSARAQIIAAANRHTLSRDRGIVTYRRRCRAITIFHNF